MSKIYVGNLPFSADESQVRALFEQHGTVESVSLINDRETGRPRGFGFVEMSSADAARAIQALNGKDMGGRPLKVNEAQDKPKGGGRGGGGGGGYGGGGGGRSGGGGYGGGGRRRGGPRRRWRLVGRRPRSQLLWRLRRLRRRRRRSLVIPLF